ncbi:hypothetical protein QMZ92_17570 [Streptomyces sp. HNM0645]|uniref:hypothetical protein n=1 Tax=Streptomyces sp. HNM0645 TaxID=2782343 RepID=UPI0024B73233|nr:hypothetical protein [Streptomyces sp. HNM0645]MDI9886141.1 hypothetical protein [Streptomyces sp. HNM0645]
MHLVDGRLESATHLSPADVRTLLSKAGCPGEVGHIYVQPPPPVAALPWGTAPSLDVVLFLSHVTLTESERAADTVLKRCRAGGLRFRGLSAMPLPLLVELLGVEG